MNKRIYVLLPLSVCLSAAHLQAAFVPEPGFPVEAGSDPLIVNSPQGGFFSRTAVAYTDAQGRLRMKERNPDGSWVSRGATSISPDGTVIFANEITPDAVLDADVALDPVSNQIVAGTISANNPGQVSLHTMGYAGPGGQTGFSEEVTLSLFVAAYLANQTWKRIRTSFSQGGILHVALLSVTGSLYTLRYFNGTWSLLGPQLLLPVSVAAFYLAINYAGDVWVTLTNPDMGQRAEVHQLSNSTLTWVLLVYTTYAVAYLHAVLAPDGILYMAFSDGEMGWKATVASVIGGALVYIGVRGFSASSVGRLFLNVGISGALMLLAADGSYGFRLSVFAFSALIAAWEYYGLPGFALVKLSKGVALWGTASKVRSEGGLFVAATDSLTDNLSVLNEVPSSGIDELQAARMLTLTPGADQTLSLRIGSGTIHQITVCDLSGRTLLHSERTPAPEQPLDLQGLPSGLYLIRVNGLLTRKYLKR